LRTGEPYSELAHAMYGCKFFESSRRMKWIAKSFARFCRACG
jgi:hypothetical protein